MDRRTQAVFQGFLLDYCRSNTKRVIVLDDREVIWTYTITTKSAATEIWRTLVAAADKRAIAPLRRNATEAQRWKLRWDIKVEGTRAGPVFIIVKVSQQTKAWDLSAPAAPLYSFSIPTY